MASIPEAEASYQVTKLVKRRPDLPDLSNLLFKLQFEGAGWLAILAKLKQELTEKPDT